jgi:HK97 family phage prohead protease
MDLERRTAVAWRATGRKLAGTVVRYHVETRIGQTIERVARGAFDDALRTGRDVLALVDHNPSSLLARTTSGTLRLRSTPEGLDFELDVPDTVLGRDTLALAERGDLGGMSFGFVVPPGGDVRQGDVRELRQVDLREISVVQSWPAYPQTSVAARARITDETRRRLAVMRRYLETVR